jgi:hypothetical protein
MVKIQVLLVWKIVGKSRHRWKKDRCQESFHACLRKNYGLFNLPEQFVPLQPQTSLPRARALALQSGRCCSEAAILQI